MTGTGTAAMPGTGHRRPDTGTLAANAVTGVILASSLITVASEKLWDRPLGITAQVLVTVVVFWLAHAFADWFGAAFRTREPATRADVLHELVSSSPLALAALPLVAPMLVARTGLWDTDTGLWISFGLTVVVFLAAAVVIVVRRRQGGWAAARFVVIAVVLGLALVTAKEILH